MLMVDQYCYQESHAQLHTTDLSCLQNLLHSLNTTDSWDDKIQTHYTSVVQQQNIVVAYRIVWAGWRKLCPHVEDISEYD